MDLNMTIQKTQPAIMKTQLGTERPVRLHDAVQSLTTWRAYAVVSINTETGRPNLYLKGHRRIRNADPKRYRILERPEVQRG